LLESIEVPFTNLGTSIVDYSLLIDKELSRQSTIHNQQLFHSYLIAVPTVVIPPTVAAAALVVGVTPGMAVIVVVSAAGADKREEKGCEEGQT
jgi:hypothetical protein